MRDAFLYCVFFASGASSLVFQMIWSRLLHHVFGSSSVAISSVVSVFMGGLALGAFLFGKVADRVKRPLVLYAFAEMGIACFGLLVPVLLDNEGILAQVNTLLRERLGVESLGFMLARFLVIVPVLIVPTTLMGATLPLLARHFVAHAHDGRTASARVGSLYAVNTAGAVTGVGVSAFLLLPALGVGRTHACALGMNFLIGAAVLLWARGSRDVRDARESASRDPMRDATRSEVAAPAYPRGTRFVAGLVFAASGACALLYEVVWSRALVSTIGASVYSFALILLTFLLGIALGSALSSALFQDRRARAALCVAAAVVALPPLLPVAVGHGSAGLASAALATAVAIAAVAFVTRERSKRSASLRALDPLAGTGTPERDGLVHEACLLVAPGVALALAAALLQGTRLAYLVLGQSAVLATLVVGLAWSRARPLLALAFSQAFIAGAVLIADASADEISLAFASMVAPLYEVLVDHVDRVMVFMFGTVSLCVLPAALGMGAAFPATLRVVSEGGARVGREVSVVYTGNTVGSILGAWLPGFVLMPAFGMQVTLHAGIVLNALLALGASLVARRQEPAHGRAGLVLAAASVGVLIVLAAGAQGFLRWDLGKMTLGVFRISLAKDVLDEEAWGEPDLVFYRDGIATTVSVERWGRHYSLKNNGKVEASNGDDMPTQIMVAALPLMLHAAGPEQLEVAIVGVGSGVTVGAALQFPVRSVAVSELEQAVIEASRYFADVNHLEYRLADYPFVQMPRLTVTNDDGRNQLASSRGRFDVIISEPSNPWIAGVADLFTVDHFRIAKRALKPGGVYGQWVQLYELSPDNVKVIYRTFASQFRYVIAFSAEDLSSDTILVGSDSPLAFDLSHLERVLAEPSVAAELERAYVHSPHAVLGRVLFTSRDEILRYAMREERLEGGRFVHKPDALGDTPCEPARCKRTPVPLNTDDNSLIELSAPRDLIGFERYKGYLGTVYGARWPYADLVGTLRGVGSGQRAAEDLADVAIALLSHGRKREAARVLDWAAQHGQHVRLDLARELSGLLSEQAVEPRFVPLPWAASLSAHSRERVGPVVGAALDHLEHGRARDAHAVVAALPEALVVEAGTPLRSLRGYLAYRAGRSSEVITELETLAREDPEVLAARPSLLFMLARAHDDLDHFDKAVRDGLAYLSRATDPSPPP